VISSPGSYFLSRSLSPGGGLSGIRITASHVTLDLKGFLIDGGNSAGSGGIVMNDELQGIVIRDGAIKGFVSAIKAGTGLRFSRISHITANGGTVAGIDLGTDASNMVEYCTAEGGRVGIRAGRVHYCQGNQKNNTDALAGIVASELVSHSTGSGIISGITGGDVSHSKGIGLFALGISGDNVSHSHGIARPIGSVGILANGNVSDSYGECSSGAGYLGSGIDAGGNVTGSTGIGGDSLSGDHNGHGIMADGNVTNSTGTGYGGYGIEAKGSVSGSFGTAASMYDPYIEMPFPGTAIKASVISYSTAATLSGATGLSCTTAVGCVSSGPDVITHRYLMP
jgi:hypothetical protein